MTTSQLSPALRWIDRSMDGLERRLPPILRHFFAANRTLGRIGLSALTSQARDLSIDSDDTVTPHIVEHEPVMHAGGMTVYDAHRRAELASRTKAELYDEAIDLDIDGRSTMNKRELVEAIHLRVG